MVEKRNCLDSDLLKIMIGIKIKRAGSRLIIEHQAIK